MVHKWCTLFEFIMSCACSYIHISPNTQTTIYIGMHTWFTSDAHCSNLQSQLYTPTYTDIILKPTIAIRIYGWFASDVQCSSSQHQVYISSYTRTHITQKTTYIRMHARFASDAHCRVHKKKLRVYSHKRTPHNTQNTIDVRMHEWVISDALFEFRILNVYTHIRT